MSLARLPPFPSLCFYVTLSQRALCHSQNPLHLLLRATARDLKLVQFVDPAFPFFVSCNNSVTLNTHRSPTHVHVTECLMITRPLENTVLHASICLSPGGVFAQAMNVSCSSLEGASCKHPAPMRSVPLQAVHRPLTAVHPPPPSPWAPVRQDASSCSRSALYHFTPLASGHHYISSK